MRHPGYSDLPPSRPSTRFPRDRCGGCLSFGGLSRSAPVAAGAEQDDGVVLVSSTFSHRELPSAGARAGAISATRPSTTARTGTVMKGTQRPPSWQSAAREQSPDAMTHATTASIGLWKPGWDRWQGTLTGAWLRARRKWRPLHARWQTNSSGHSSTGPTTMPGFREGPRATLIERCRSNDLGEEELDGLAALPW